MKIEVKRQEIKTVKLTKITERAQKEKINQINSEIKELEKQAQEFESILNKKQKAELEKMKAENRARYKIPPTRPPFAGLGTPGFLMSKPLFPQQPQMDFFNK